MLGHQVARCTSVVVPLSRSCVKSIGVPILPLSRFRLAYAVKPCCQHKLPSTSKYMTSSYPIIAHSCVEGSQATTMGMHSIS